jgi:hypothetical protein
MHLGYGGGKGKGMGRRRYLHVGSSAGVHGHGQRLTHGPLHSMTHMLHNISMDCTGWE